MGNFSVDKAEISAMAWQRSRVSDVRSSRAIIEERNARGKFKTLKDFVERLSGKEVNKRTIESFIKAGAFDSLGGTRKQFMMIYIRILDQVNQERKYSMAGQMSLFRSGG
ncbi:MAG: hypothetical protein V8S08_08750 [Lachnoclostridium sp.]